MKLSASFDTITQGLSAQSLAAFRKRPEQTELTGFQENLGSSS